MAEYIDRRAVLDAIPQANNDKTVALFGVVADFIVLVSEIPAADVAPVVHGHWVYGEFGIPHCSECGEEAKLDMISPFCPNCGAKMDEEV